MPELSVVVLCYRSEDSIVEFVNQLESEMLNEKINFELILVANFDEYEKDNTPEIVAGLAKGKQ
jgi:glycosyltransferase involved in cell wall biosynthesis